MSKKEELFKDLRVLELASVLAGPAVGMFFAELGAKVTKVENKTTGGDVTRSWKLPEEDAKSNESAYFRSVNWGKKSVFLNFLDNKDKEKLHKLISKADILISSFKPGDEKKLGLEKSIISKLNPRIIHAKISGYPSGDKRVAYDLVLQAETGYMSMNGTEESGPVKMPVALIDVLAAHQLKEAVLIALLQKSRNGRGSTVSVSLYESAIAALTNQATNYFTTGKSPQRMGSLHPNIAPYGEIFSTKDNAEIVLAVGSDKQFYALCEMFDRDDLAKSPLFKTNKNRVQNRIALKKELESFFIQSKSKAIMKQLNERNIPASPILSLKSTFENKNAKKLLLTSKDSQSQCVKTAIFNIQPHK